MGMGLLKIRVEKPKDPGTRPTSLARHIFVRVAFPVGIVFLSCFSLLDRLVQSQLRDHIRQELVARDSQTQRAHASGDERVRRSAGALAEASGITIALRPGGKTTNASFVNQLTQLGNLLDEDVYSIAGTDKAPVATVRRNGKDLLEASHDAPITATRQLGELDGDYYFFSSYPLVRDGKSVGWLTTGRHWLREMPLDGVNWYLITKNREVMLSTGKQQAAAVQPGVTLPDCATEDSPCEVEVGGQRFLLLRSASGFAHGGYEAYLIHSFDVLASPLLGIMRNLMVAGAFLSIIGALGLTFLTGNAIARPLQELTRSCAKAQETGNLSDIEAPPSRIAEVNALAKTLHGAVQSIEVGQRQLSQTYFQFMGAIVAMLDARDPYTAGHSHRVSAYSEALAKDFGLPQDQVDDIRIGALLHDIGKIGVPDEVLHKHERLTKEEFDLMKQHPTIGREVLEQVAQFEKYLDAVELHHENLDGTGYPRGLRGEQIPIAARIVKVADVYDALSTDRPYRKSMPVEQVHEILRKGAGMHFDRLLVEIFLNRCVPRFEQRNSPETLIRAVGENTNPPVKRNAVGA